jgi:hypothetical protein
MMSMDGLAGLGLEEEEELAGPPTIRSIMRSSHASRSGCSAPVYLLQLEALLVKLEPLEVTGPNLLEMLREQGDVPLQAILALGEHAPADVARRLQVMEGARWSRHHVQLIEAVGRSVGLRRTAHHVDGLGIGASCSCKGAGERHDAVTYVPGTRRVVIFR